MNNALLYAITVAIWGASWYGITLQLGGVAPEASVAYRFALAALILVAWCGVRGLSLRFSAREHGFAALMGFFIFCFSYILFYYAAGEVTSGLMALSFSSLILFNGLFGVLFLGSPMRPRVAFGAIVGIAGIGLVFWPDLAGLGGGRATLGGMAFCVLATVSVSLGNIISARNQLAGMPVLQTNAFGMAYAAALVSVYAIIAGKPFAFAWTPTYIGSLVYLALFASVIAFGCYLTLLGRIGADRAAYVMILHPVVALGLSTLLEDFRWGWPAVAGVVLVLAGNVIVLRPARRPTRAPGRTETDARCR